MLFVSSISCRQHQGGYTDLVASGECYLYHRSVVDNITAVIPILLLVENVICIIDQWWTTSRRLYQKFEKVSQVKYKSKWPFLWTLHWKQKMKFKPPIFQGNSSTYIITLGSMRLMRWVMFTTWVMILSIVPFSLTKCWMTSSVDGILAMTQSFWKLIMLGTSINVKTHLCIIKTWRISITYDHSFILSGSTRQRIDRWNVEFRCQIDPKERHCDSRGKVQPGSTHAGKTMIYQHTDLVKIDAKRINRPQLPITGCMKQHLFDYKPRSKKILCRE